MAFCAHCAQKGSLCAFRGLNIIVGAYWDLKSLLGSKTFIELKAAQKKTSEFILVLKGSLGLIWAHIFI